jgi:hypothetical protein
MATLVSVPKERQSIDKAAPYSRLTLRKEEPQRERRVLHQKIALCVGVLALSLTALGSASAQPAPPPYYPGVARPITAVLPPYEILAILRTTGLEPLSRPWRHGPWLYTLHAVNPSGREVKVIVDARTGRVLHVLPVLVQRYVLPPSYGYGPPPGQIANAPDGYGANSRIATKPPSVEGPAMRGLPAGALPAVPVPAAAPPRSTAQAGPPPLPRPRPKLAAAESTPAIIAAPQAPPPQAAPPQVEAKDTRAQPRESETAGAIKPAAPAPVEAHE